MAVVKLHRRGVSCEPFDTSVGMGSRETEAETLTRP